MLVDELLSDPILKQAGTLSMDLRDRLSRAMKFVLRRDAAMAADEFSSNRVTENMSNTDVDNINKALPLARLPFRECWFEVAQDDRRFFAEAPFDEGTSKLNRIGWLLTEINAQGAWSAQMFWSFAKSAPVFMGHRLPTATSGFIAEVDPHQSDAVAALTLRLDNNTDPIHRRLSDPSDWIGEPGFLIATLALLNSKNAIEVETTDLQKKNKCRARAGKVPLFSYHLICIPSRYKHQHIGSDRDGRELRAHFVRGHFKVRKTGIYFWSAFQRGNPALGFVRKDYIVARPTA